RDRDEQQHRRRLRPSLDLAPVGLDGPPVDDGDQCSDGEEHGGEHLTKLEAHPAPRPGRLVPIRYGGSRTVGRRGVVRLNVAMPRTPRPLYVRTDRLTLRMLARHDITEFTRYRNLPDVARYQDWALPYTRDLAHELVDEMEAMGRPE